MYWQSIVDSIFCSLVWYCCHIFPPRTAHFIWSLEVGRLLMSHDSTPFCWAKELRAVCNLLFASERSLFHIVSISIPEIVKCSTYVGLRSACLYGFLKQYRWRLLELELCWSIGSRGVPRSKLQEGLVSSFHFLEMLNARYHIILHGPPQSSDKMQPAKP